jgi:hypothetical protein
VTRAVCGMRGPAAAFQDVYEFVERAVVVQSVGVLPATAFGQTVVVQL